VGCAAAPSPDVTGPAAAAEGAHVTFGSDTLRVEVANTEAERARGLMGRERLAEGTGMLFVFPEAAVQGVWMRDTPLPLDAAFLDANRRILSIERLEPFDETVRYSEAPVLYVLEAPRGWFERHGVDVGDVAGIAFLEGG
jgi:uncharacterized membrane protein (UPF0127 family)